MSFAAHIVPQNLRQLKIPLFEALLRNSTIAGKLVKQAHNQDFAKGWGLEPKVKKFLFEKSGVLSKLVQLSASQTGLSLVKTRVYRPWKDMLFTYIAMFSIV